MYEILKIITSINEFQRENETILGPPEEGFVVYECKAINKTLVKGTRGYIEKITNQINGTYANGWYDSCAVMIRRLIETLIIEVYEHYSLEPNIKDGNGDYLFLKDLIDKFMNETRWTIGRNVRKALPKLKDVGDKSAHSRRFNANKTDIDNLLGDLRDVTQELIYLAVLK
jgi:hypothetical protein